jgi:crotonobetainyl-CoA:carnitine CoA-transferase CaiB-like acyl-CoA transferase
LDHPQLGRVRSAASPLRLSATPPVYERPPPTVGEHSDEILHDWLDLDAVEIADLRRAGAV